MAQYQDTRQLYQSMEKERGIPPDWVRVSTLFHKSLTLVY